MNVSRASTKVFGARVFSTVVSFAALSVFARELGPAAMGVYFLFQGVTTLLSLPVDLGVGTAVEQRVSAGEDPGRAIATALVLRVIALAVVGAGIVAGRSFLTAYIGADLTAFLLAAVAVGQLNTLLMAVLRAELRVGESAEIQLARQVAWVGVAGGLVVYGLEVRALVVGTVVASAVALAWTLLKVETPLGRPSVAQARSLLDYARYNFVPSVGLRVHNWMDVLVIGWFLTSTEVGTYEIAWRVAGITTLLASAVSMTVLPQTSAWQAESDLDAIGRLLSNLFVPALGLVIPSIFGVLILAPELLGALFGPEYTGAALVLIVLVVGKIPEAVQMLAGKCLLGLDRPDLVARATIVGLVANFVLNVVLVWQFGPIGAAVGTTLAFSAGMVLRVRYLQSHITLHVPLQKLGWCTFSAVVMAAVVQSVETSVGVDSLPALLGAVALGGAVYGVVLFAYPPLRHDGLNYVRTTL